MNAYILRADTNSYNGIVPINPADWDVFNRFDGSTLVKSWLPLNVSYNVDESRRLSESDFPSLLTHVPVFSQRAVDVLGTLLTENGELLPLNCHGKNYFAYNVTNLVDALDFRQSEIVRFSTGRIMDIKKYVFRSESLSEVTVFKLPQTPRMDVFVTDPFVERVRSSALSGFLPEETWNS